MESFPGYTQIQEELVQAESARAGGNEGMARVCARRAAGIAAGEYIRRRGLNYSVTSAYDRLNFLAGSDSVPDDIRQVTGRFLVRVMPDHTLPIETDLVAEARWLVDKLLASPE